MSMAECKQAVLVEKETVHRDCLTGCYDKMTIQYLVDLCFLKSDVRQSHAMFVIDVDNFKRVNDTWGRDSRMGTGGISGLEHTRAAALFCAGTAFYLRGSCLTPVFI